jgi:uncharacterized protein YqeY
MSISAVVQEELKKAMLAKDAVRTTGLRMIRAAIIELSKTGSGEPDDAKILEALRRLKKQREESITAYEAAGRNELAATEKVELEIIEGFLPKLADEATTLAWVKEAIVASGATNVKEVGKAMGALMKAHKNDPMDAGLAKALLTRELGG